MQIITILKNKNKKDKINSNNNNNNHFYNKKIIFLLFNHLFQI